MIKGKVRDDAGQNETAGVFFGRVTYDIVNPSRTDADSKVLMLLIVLAVNKMHKIKDILMTFSSTLYVEEGFMYAY